MIGVKCFANFQASVRDFITKKLKCLYLSLSIKKICVIENIDEALVIFISGLYSSFGLLGKIIYFTNAISQTPFYVKTDKYSEPLVLKLLVYFLKT